MNRRASVVVVILVTFIMWMGNRATAIALPLVALQETGNAWATGLVAGASAIPIVTVPWWGRGLRERMSSGRALGATLVVQAGGLTIVPVAAAMGHVGFLSLSLSGLVVGAAVALQGPGVRALLADLGDLVGRGNGARYLSIQDLAHRSSMFVAPPLGALAVANGHTMGLLWLESAAALGSAVLIAAVPGVRTRRAATPTTDEEATRVRDVLRAYPRMSASVATHTAVALAWFAFSLGLAIQGAELGRPGILIAAGMTGYGVASTATSFVAPFLVMRLPAWPTAIVPAMGLGVTFALLPLAGGSAAAVLVLSAVGGLAMPLGIAAHNRILSSDPDQGPDRRAAFTADGVFHHGGTAVGMLLGGLVIGICGVSATLVGAGIFLTSVGILVLVRAPQNQPVVRPQVAAF